MSYADIYGPISVLAVKTYPNADCSSDHEMLAAKTKVKKSVPLKNITQIPTIYRIKVKNRFELLDTAENS